MRFRSVTILLLLLLTAEVCSAQVTQSTSEKKEPIGSISGRVMLGEQPAAGVMVQLFPYQQRYGRPARSCTTDVNGKFQLSSIAGGRFLLKAFAPAYVGPGSEMREGGKVINLNEDETIDQLDITLQRGGVITGRVVDSEGHPLIQQQVRLWRIDESGQRAPLFPPSNEFANTTDDRGVYRLFGIQGGRYTVSVGTDTRQTTRIGDPIYYPLTFHPDVTDLQKADVVEVSAGSEATGIDITIGSPVRGHRVFGRAVLAETGAPVPGLNYGYGIMQKDGNNFQSSTVTGSITDAKGQFKMDGILPGHYTAFAMSGQDGEFYSDSTVFDITDSDITIEVKVHRGSNVIGSVVIEGGDSGAPKLSDLSIGGNTSSATFNNPRYAPLKLGIDGSFQMTGLKPGKLNFFVATYPIPKNIAVIRVERDGVEQPNGIDLHEGETISGVKVILGYGSGSIRGQIKIEGGTLPDNAEIVVQCRRLGDDQKNKGPMQNVPDARGLFLFEGLQPGEYELLAWASRVMLVKAAKEVVTVSNGELPVTLTLQLLKTQ